MKRPKMIMFDYGNTLVSETSFNAYNGMKAVLEYAKKYKNVDAQVLADMSNKIYQDSLMYSKDSGIEVNNLSVQRFIFDYYGLSFDLSDCKIEKIFWDNASFAKPMKDINDFIEYINTLGIRSAVISNISFTGINLCNRLNELIPNNKFEFVLASSDYMYRKPNKLLYKLALKKAGLRPEEVWFCGDRFEIDVLGAKEAGMFPIYFDADEKFESSQIEGRCKCIKYWSELIDMIQHLKSDI